MNLKEFLSDPTLQKDENGNILCRKIKNSKLHHMKPQFCMSPRLHSEGWEIVRKLLPPPFEFTTEPKAEYENKGKEFRVVNIPVSSDVKEDEIVNGIPDSEIKEKVFSNLSKKGMTDISQSTDAPEFMPQSIGLPEGVEPYKEVPENENPVSVTANFKENNEPVKVKQKRKKKRKTTTKRKRTVKTLIPETNNG